ncbi:MAG: alkaline phosphatase, partial [Verrucomicrobiia bacterium]
LPPIHSPAMSLPLTRRQWLIGAGAGASLATLPLTSCAASARPKNVILLVSDGMSQGVPQMAETFSRHLRNRGTHLAALTEEAGTAKGFFETSTLVSMVTDSAAASSAWGSGCQVVNGAINVLPDGTRLTPIMETLNHKGIATGLVTTARVTHATPAGFASAVVNRAMEDLIATQYLGIVDVILGGGSYYFDPDFRDDGRDLLADYAREGYTLLTQPSDLLHGERHPRALGLFAIDHLPFTLDQQRLAQPSTPTLAEMTRAALARLGRTAGFFLMIEAARVDHAAHANDIGGLLWDQLAFDDALGEALAFQKNDRGTLIIVATDHGNANPGVNGVGPGYTSSSLAFQQTLGQSESFIALAQRLVEQLRQKPSSGSPDIGAEVARALGLDLTRNEQTALFEALQIQPDTGRRPIGERFYPLLGRIQEARTAVGWSGIVHTSDWAMVVARGPGQERFARLQHHTAFYDHLAWFFGFSRQNQPFQGPLPPVEPHSGGPEAAVM